MLKKDGGLDLIDIFTQGKNLAGKMVVSGLEDDTP
jgi:hypothetical protein